MKNKIWLVSLIVILSLALAVTVMAGKKKYSLKKGINLNLKPNFQFNTKGAHDGGGKIVLKNKNFKDLTKLQSEGSFQVKGKVGKNNAEIKAEADNIKSLTSLESLGVYVEGAKKLLKKIKSQEIENIKIKLKAETGYLVVVTPKKEKDEEENQGDKPQPPPDSEILHRATGFPLNRCIQILDEYGQIRVFHALENSKGPKKFWLLVKGPEYDGLIKNNTLYHRFYYPNGKQNKKLKDLSVNVSILKNESKDLVMAERMQFLSDSVAYKTKLIEENDFKENFEPGEDWLVPVDNLEPGNYELRVDVIGHLTFITKKIKITDDYQVKLIN